MPPELEYRMWRQIKGAFTTEPVDMRLIFVPKLHESTSVEQYDTMEEALAVAGDAPKVFLEHRSNKFISEIPKGDIILVLGNTESSNENYAKDGEAYRINTPGATDMYGINAAAIALAYRAE